MMIKTNGLTKIFSSKKAEVIALNELNLDIPENKFVLVKGPSGCGKSTLLFMLGGMLIPSSGMVEIEGQDLYQLTSRELTSFRAKNIGFVFQSYHLIPYLNVVENVLFKSKSGENGQLLSKATDLLKELNISDRKDHKPAELSIGEKQRVALARALIREPRLILADEPTGNLDPENAKEVLAHLSQYKKDGGTVVMVSHSGDADHLADMIIHMKNGKIDKIEKN